MDSAKVTLGALLIAISCVVLAHVGAPATRTLFSLGALGAVGLSLGSLLVDAVGA